MMHGNNQSYCIICRFCKYFFTPEYINCFFYKVETDRMAVYIFSLYFYLFNIILLIFFSIIIIIKIINTCHKCHNPWLLFSVYLYMCYLFFFNVSLSPLKKISLFDESLILCKKKFFKSRSTWVSKEAQLEKNCKNNNPSY